jgi:hypothetical protein
MFVTQLGDGVSRHGHGKGGLTRPDSSGRQATVADEPAPLNRGRLGGSGLHGTLRHVVQD